MAHGKGRPVLTSDLRLFFLRVRPTDFHTRSREPSRGKNFPACQPNDHLSFGWRQTIEAQSLAFLSHRLQESQVEPFYIGPTNKKGSAAALPLGEAKPLEGSGPIKQRLGHRHRRGTS
jgi:hypothetical protein